MFGFISKAYDAINDKQRRRPPKVRTYSEDYAVDYKDREKLAATARDVFRNFGVARWAVNKHLDYVSSFSFQATSDSDAANDAVEAFMAQWSQRQGADVAQRHPLRRLIRLAECVRTLDGDFGFVKIAGSTRARGTLQAVEGARIARTPDIPKTLGGPQSFPNGVRTTRSGRAVSYHVANRNEDDRLVFGRIVGADNFTFHAHFDRIDQVRGISPIVSSLNTLQDIYEGIDYAQAKTKLSLMFGLAIFRAGEEGLGEYEDNDADGDGNAETGKVDLGRGPFQLDLDGDDRAEFLESATPATETVEFLKMMIHVALKALDIPYSFFDESFTNFYGSRGGLIQYLKSCKDKIRDIREMLDDITRWRLGMAIADGDITLPAGVAFDDLSWDWVPDGVPWWDPAKEVQGHRLAIASGLTDYQTVCREAGTDFYTNVDRRAEQEAYAAERGVVLDLGIKEMPEDDGEDDDDE